MNAVKSFKLDNDAKLLTSLLVNPTKRRLWKSILDHPEYPTNVLRLGRQLSRDNQFDEKVILYRYASRKHSHSYRLLLQLARAYENAGDEVAAIRTYKRLVKRFPDRFQAYLRLEKIYRRALNYDLAIKLYENIDPANPIKERGFQRLFHIFAIAGQLENAGRVLQKAIAHYGETYSRCLELGKLYLRRGDFLDAVQSFESAVAFHPDWDEPRTWLGIALKELGNLRLAEYEFNEILKIKPDSYQGLIHLAELHIQGKRYQEAREYLDRIEEKVPENARVDICRGWIALREKDPEHAIEYCRRGLQRTRFYFVWEQVLAHRILARAHGELGQEEEKEFNEMMVEAIAAKDTYESLIKLAEDLIKRKNCPMARRVFERVLQLFPRNTRARVGLGEVALKDGYYDEAVTICRQALESIKPIFGRERIRAYTIIGLAHKHQGKDDLSKDALKTAHALIRQLYLKPGDKSGIRKGRLLEKLK